MKPYLLVKCYLHLYTNTVCIQLVYKMNVHNYSAYNRTYTILIYTTSVFLSIYFKCISHLKIIYMHNIYDFVNMLFISLYNILHLIENFQTKLVEIYVSSLCTYILFTYKVQNTYAYVIYITSYKNVNIAVVFMFLFL